MRSADAEALAKQLFISRIRSQGPVYLHAESAEPLLKQAQNVIAEIRPGETERDLLAPSAWHALICLWWLAKRAATKDVRTPPFNKISMGSRSIFRGQKAHYTLAPSIRRNRDEDRLFHEVAVYLIWITLNELLESSPDRLLQVLYSSVTLEEATCIAQHYKTNKGPKTFLMDWSFDPLIACHFATRHALDGELDDAAVYILSFDQALRSGMKILGPPVFAGRLYDQKGLFLDAKGTAQDLDPTQVLRLRFPTQKCVEIPWAEARPYDPLEMDSFVETVIERSLRCAMELTPQQRMALLSGSESRNEGALLEIGRGIQLVAPWQAAVNLLMPSSDRSNEVRLIENMLVRFLDWAAFRARLDGESSDFFYDSGPLKLLAQSSPSIFVTLAKTTAMLVSAGKKPDKRVEKLLQTIQPKA